MQPPRIQVSEEAVSNAVRFSLSTIPREQMPSHHPGICTFRSKKLSHLEYDVVNMRYHPYRRSTRAEADTRNLLYTKIISHATQHASLLAGDMSEV